MNKDQVEQTVQDLKQMTDELRQPVRPTADTDLLSLQQAAQHLKGHHAIDVTAEGLTKLLDGKSTAHMYGRRVDGVWHVRPDDLSMVGWYVKRLLNK